MYKRTRVLVERLENILEIYFLNASIGKKLVVLVNDESLDTRVFFWKTRNNDKRLCLCFASILEIYFRNASIVKILVVLVNEESLCTNVT
jgi:hypothetical protein